MCLSKKAISGLSQMVSESWTPAFGMSINLIREFKEKLRPCETAYVATQLKGLQKYPSFFEVEYVPLLANWVEAKQPASNL
jgi:hypothetical protein